jgi:hypothetical protein
MKFETYLNSNSPIICNIPHSSINIPDIFESDFYIEFFSVTDHNFGISEIKGFILKISYEDMDD